MTSGDWADLELPPRTHILLVGVPRAGRSAELVKAERANRRRGQFTHSNASTSELSDALTAANMRHEQVRLSEAYGEALNAQLAIQLHLIGVEQPTAGARVRLSRDLRS